MRGRTEQIMLAEPSRNHCSMFSPVRGQVVVRCFQSGWLHGRSRELRTGDVKQLEHCHVLSRDDVQCYLWRTNRTSMYTVASRMFR